MTVINQRSELLFLYDVVNANPNGDPVDENKPRIDEETGVNIVTDVRLKRTVRDYLYDYKNQEVFIVELRAEDGTLLSKDDRLKAFKDPQEIVQKCIDVRLFGATTAVKDKTMTLTGPVQFKYGRSLHKVNLTYVKGTTVMPSGQSKTQGTFTERYILPYSLIAFYGIVNENAAQRQKIDLTQQDIDLLLEAMWNGTKNLLSTSKAGQMPRLLMQVVHKEENYHLGELDRRIKLLCEKDDTQIRDIKEVSLDITELSQALLAKADVIDRVRYAVDPRLQLVKEGAETSVESALSGLSLEQLPF